MSSSAGWSGWSGSWLGPALSCCEPALSVMTLCGVFSTFRRPVDCAGSTTQHAQWTGDQRYVTGNPPGMERGGGKEERWRRGVSVAAHPIVIIELSNNAPPVDGDHRADLLLQQAIETFFLQLIGSSESLPHA